VCLLETLENLSATARCVWFVPCKPCLAQATTRFECLRSDALAWPRLPDDRGSEPNSPRSMAGAPRRMIFSSWSLDYCLVSCVAGNIQIDPFFFNDGTTAWVYGGWHSNEVVVSVLCSGWVNIAIFSNCESLECMIIDVNIFSLWFRFILVKLNLRQNRGTLLFGIEGGVGKKIMPEIHKKKEGLHT